MIRSLLIAFIIVLSPGYATGQDNKEIAFISDTQAPLGIETLIHKTHHNAENTARLFKKIESMKPLALFISGDITSLGAKDEKWENMDHYLNDCASLGIPLYASLGNHDVMRNAKKGRENFHKRFTKSSDTGYCVVVDSVAVLLMNSNFKKMAKGEPAQQQKWYTEKLKH